MSQYFCFWRHRVGCNRHQKVLVINVILFMLVIYIQLSCYMLYTRAIVARALRICYEFCTVSISAFILCIFAVVDVRFLILNFSRLYLNRLLLISLRVTTRNVSYRDVALPWLQATFCFGLQADIVLCIHYGCRLPWINQTRHLYKPSTDTVDNRDYKPRGQHQKLPSNGMSRDGI